MAPTPISIFTEALQGGQASHDARLIPSAPPIAPAVGFIHPTMAETDAALGSPGGSVDHRADYIYARNGAPTQAAFEEVMAALEGAPVSLCFGSGMAALHAALLACVPAGGKIAAAEQLYGVTRTLLTWLAQTMGVQVVFVDALDPDAAGRTIRELRPDALICEALTNPLARVIRLDALLESAREVGARSIVDNTFATPFLLRPLERGASLVVHSATKFLNGHGDVTAGVVSGDAALMETVRTHRKVLGGILGAFEAWLALRGVRTLPLRMRQACGSALKLAEWMRGHPRISRVYYPGLPDDPCHDDTRRLFREGYFGAMMAFAVEGLDREAAFRLMEGLRLIRPITSLGDLNTLVSHPATSSHRALSAEQRLAQGITEGTLRLSVGIEDPDDLIADLDQTLAAAG